MQTSHHRNHPTISVSTLEGSQIYIFSLNALSAQVLPSKNQIVPCSLTTHNLRHNMGPPHPNTPILSIAPSLSDWSQPCLFSSSSPPPLLNHASSPEQRYTDNLPCIEHTCTCLTLPFPHSQPLLGPHFIFAILIFVLQIFLSLASPSLQFICPIRTTTY